MEKITVENKRLRVTLPVDEFNEIGRYGVFNDAMRKLGSISELKLLQIEKIDDADVIDTARKGLIAEFLKKNTIYNFSEILCRWLGGHRMSAGMRDEICRAEKYADENIDTFTDDSRSHLEAEKNLEIRYRTHHANMCKNWEIEIIGDMPEQIGMCRFQ